MRADLLTEFKAAVVAATDAEWQAILEAGVTIKALAHQPIPNIFGVAAVRPISDTLYEPVEEGPRAYILPTNLIGDASEIEDLIAFTLTGSWRLRRGIAAFLGEHHVENRTFGPGHVSHLDSGYTEDPLNLYRNPMEWLKAGTQGCVVLDWRFATMALTAQRSPIVAEDLMHGEEVHERLTRTLPVPEIHIPEEVAA